MTAHVLITGALFRPPEQRTSRAGKSFVTATLKAKDGDPSTASQWWKVLAFSETKTAKSGSLCRSSTTRRGWTIMMRYLFERPNSVE
jgi:ABC-type thiamine transport system substrate-binding protein